MYARGATPEMTAPSAFVPASPAAIPATCVPCDSFGSNGTRSMGAVWPRAGNARATITLADV